MDLFVPATEMEMRSELSRMPRGDLLALAEMHILFTDAAAPEAIEAFRRRRQIARDLAREDTKQR